MTRQSTNGMAVGRMECQVIQRWYHEVVSRNFSSYILECLFVIIG